VTGVQTCALPILTGEQLKKIKEVLPIYIKSKPDVTFRKNPLTLWNPNANPAVVAEDIRRRTVIELNPSISTAPKDGVLKVDRNGNKAIVYPDGSFKEVR
jgi:hypothetical protein